MVLNATRTIRRMPGGSQSQLMLGSDDNLWVVKFMNNPQGMHVLTNELIAGQIAKEIGLTVPPIAMLDVSKRLVAENSQMFIETVDSRHMPCSAGLNLGSQFKGDMMSGHVIDSLPLSKVDNIENREEFTGVLAFDIWTENTDARQAVFTTGSQPHTYRAFFIDNGNCFNHTTCRRADSSTFLGIYKNRASYANSLSLQSINPWLKRIETFSPVLLKHLVEQIPRDWCSEKDISFHMLSERLLERARNIRRLVSDFLMKV